MGPATIQPARGHSRALPQGQDFRGSSGNTKHQPGAHRHQDSDTHRITTKPVPTIVVASSDWTLRETIKNGLQEDGFHVLEADSALGARHCVVAHSRPIHYLLVDIDMVDAASTRVLKRYRPLMQVVFMTGHSAPTRSGSVDVNVALRTVRNLIPEAGMQV